MGRMTDEPHIIKQLNRIERENERQDGDWKIVSQPLHLKGIDNLRDMGGIPTRNGRVIRTHMLFRSANLHKASDAALHELDTLGLRNVIDLRTKQECRLEEDRLLPDWQYDWFPMFQEMGEFGSQIKGIVANPGTFIESLYPQMLKSDTAVHCWRECFVRLLDEPGAYLWHCTQGKDRTGGLAALILAALDVSDELIVEDYLETNLFMPHITSTLAKKVESVLGERVDGDINQFLIAAPAYIRAFMHAADEYGGLGGFLRERVGLSDADFAKLRDTYTEPAK